ncbi:RNA 2',3'-cyclic phosphodiesterase [candidate division KSB1 bacterium]
MKCGSATFIYSNYMRTFIAIDVSDEVRRAVGAFTSVLKRENARVSWVKPENVHITLKFLGEIDKEKIPGINEAIQVCARNQKPFEIEIKGSGGFPNLNRPRVIWVGMTEGAEELKRLAGAVDNELSKLGFQKEKRAFKPHLTIGRVKTINDTESFIEKMNSTDFYGGRFTAGEMLLMKSDLKPTGAEYTKLETVNLNNRQIIN